MTINDSIRTSYEESPYPYMSYRETHPDNMAVIATLLGLKPASVQHCRVLEIGCAVGGNLIPMAQTLPESYFLGIDISPKQIQAGQETITELGLSNIELKALNMMDIGYEIGEFDYIIAHGIYSWVPEDVRDKLIELCHTHLSAHGIAYISYNTYPGWHMVGTLRDMMMYGIRDLDETEEKIAKSLDLVDFVSQSIEQLQASQVTFFDAYQNLMSGYDQFITKQRETSTNFRSLIVHDEIAPINHPVYFHQFAQHIAGYELQYLSEADLSSVMPTRLPESVVKKLISMSQDIIEMEQYMDFLANRTFRKTLICHAHQPIQRNLTPDPQIMAGFYVACSAQIVTRDIALESRDIMRLQASDEIEFASDHPVTKAAFALLTRNFPMNIAIMDLYVYATQAIYQSAPDRDTQLQDLTLLCANLLQAYTFSNLLVDLQTVQSSATTQISEKPLASSYARWQVTQDYNTVTNVNHQRIQLDTLSKFLLPLLDGEHDIAVLRAKLGSLVSSGKIKIQKYGQEISDPEEIQQRLHSEVKGILKWFAQVGLLIA